MEVRLSGSIDYKCKLDVRRGESSLHDNARFTAMLESV